MGLPRSSNIIATWRDDRTLRLWDPTTGVLRATLLALESGGYAVLLPDGSYKLDGEPGRSLWWVIKLCRFAPGELDGYDPSIHRLTADAPIPLTPAEYLNMSERILITGAAGAIGAMLRRRMARPERILRLLDIAPLPEAEPGERVETVAADITDLDAMRHAARDVDAIIHLAGIAHESDWQSILHANIHGTYAVLEAARGAGVPRVILASSNHAVGFHPYSDGLVPDYVFPRPDTYYGVSKATNEALGSLYHDRYGIDVLCVRIGSCFDKPTDHRMLSTWLSPDDCARLMEALLAAPNPGFRVLWGISANTRARFSPREARALGYQPRDDAEDYADALPPPSVSDTDRYIGGSYCE